MPNNQETRTGRIFYGGYAQHVVHYVVADDTKEKILISGNSVEIALNRMMERQRQMKREGYTGPFGLPHHCLTYNQQVAFTVTDGKAEIIF